MIKVKINQLSLNDVLYDTGYFYDHKQEYKKVVIQSLKFEEGRIVINDCYWLYKIINNSVENYYNKNLYFSEKKANNVINNYIEMRKRNEEKYKKKEEQKEKYKQQIIDDKLEEKYIGKPIMLNRGENGWIKRKVKEIIATESGIYLIPDFCGHICKLSREGKTWKMWSELEELEEEKKKLEERINALKGEDNVSITN